MRLVKKLFSTWLQEITNLFLVLKVCLSLKMVRI